MNDDAYCFFILLACMLSLAMPSTGQVIVAVFTFALATAAQLAPVTDRPRHNVRGR
jgi:hypothetical protein